MYQINKLSKKLKMTYKGKKTTSMIIRMLPMPRSMTYSWLANVASCDAHIFFSNGIGFSSFSQDPQVQ